MLGGREPSFTELGIFSVMWSEHCSYKSSRIHLKRLPTHSRRVLQGPGENAGIIDIGDGWACAFKIESHNHPSFIEPFQGATTGVGGILRDIFTMGARPVATSDLFEDDLRKISESDSTRLGARGALFLKGRVQGKYLLTLRYDSEKETGERLFRDIQPDEFYPVYGDSSVKGFDAQSTSSLYVRVDKNQSFVLYGDFLTAGQDTSDSLSRYSRSLNGASPACRSCWAR